MADTRRDLGLIALVIGFALLATAVLGTLWLFREQQQSQRWVVHTLRAQEQLRAVLSDLQDAETGQRGYLITRDREYLTPYLDGKKRLSTDLETLRSLLADNPEQIARLDRLSDLALRRVARLDIGIGRAKDLSYDPGSDMRGGVGKPLMDASRAKVREMLAVESALLDTRIERVQSLSRQLSFWLIVCLAATAGLAWFAARDARRRAAAAITAGEALEDANARLIEEAATREAVEAQVRQMHKMESVGQLTGGIAHDFNNMLAIVIGSLDMAKRRMTKDPRKAEASIDNAMQGAERAAQLTSRLLAFSRQQPLAPQALDANKLVGGMSELLRRTIGETIQFETVLAGGLWPAFIDAGQLESALVNLCVNGRDAMPEGGRLTIETANTHLDEGYAASHNEVTPGQYVMVSVTDTGGGMPAEVIERAFDPFFTTKGVGKGTGLGLSQVYGFVKQSGGHVKIYSEPGVGTTVKLYLKRHFGIAEQVTTIVPEGDLPRAKRGEVVLVVEDEERVRQLSVETLRELGYAVVHAGTPNAALELIRSEPRIDLLFTDVVMPEMNGRQLAERAVAMRPGLKVLYTTGYTRNSIVHNGVLDHDVHFLAKPFTIAQLAGKVRQVIDAAA
ncbi:CHASE3 domain-containing protein [Sphingomonas sp. G-3-2-10]|uniref:CHASE3 domain-containing protein n=1 Tax=Sphingomonas sp. G-3-2-10 TaxID=2728838 RepID=UPI001469A013|nr:CHASE3 domain-containing protein [Sphingomonas sp. G-3-2-10]NML06137.1 response regulator [Sphingomonas sp. G-3-2-10]